MSKYKLDSSGILNQEFRRKWAYYGATYLGNDLFYLKEFVDLCIQDLGEEETKQELIDYQGSNEKKLNKIGKDWDDFLLRYKAFGRKIIEAKGFYDKIEKKDFTKIESKDVLDFLGLSKRIPLIQDEIYALAIFFLKMSRVKDNTIQEAEWKVLEHSGLKKIEVRPKRPVPKDEGIVPPVGGTNENY